MLNKTIAFLSLTDCMGGAELFLSNLFNYKKSNSDFYFLTHNTTKKVRTENIYYLSETPSYFIGFFELLLYSKKLRNYNIIITSHIYLNAALGSFKKLGLINKNVKLVFRESTSIFIREKGIRLLKYKIAYHLGYGPQVLTITQSDLMKKQLLDNFPKSKNWKIKSIPNPINLDLIIQQSNEYVFNEKNYMVTAGRLIPEKGYDILIESFNKIKNKTDKQLLILGEGNERENLELLISANNLSKRVKLLGFKDNPMPYFKHADLCVVSSRVEGFPNVLLQMMALNGNVVSTLCAGGIDELEGVQTCEADDLEALSSTLFNAIRDKKNNTNLFQKELETRSIENYWNQIETYLNEA